MNHIASETENVAAALSGISAPVPRPPALKLCGTVSPPADMMEAARLSLSEQAFADLMEQTGGKAPTPDELCKMVDAARQANAA